MMLSENFSLRELTRSQTASRLGIRNQPKGEILHALERLCVNVLQPIRDRFGPVNVNSGYRGTALNKAIGGALKSQHMRGEAADVEVFGTDNLDVALWIRDSDLRYDQLILECYVEDEGPNSGWIHISHTGGLNRRQILTASRETGVMVYRPGLPEG